MFGGWVLRSNLCDAGLAQVVAAQTSPDGKQQGTVKLAEDGSSGSVSSSAQGTESASASSTVSVGPDSSQGAFVAQGGIGFCEHGHLDSSNSGSGRACGHM